MGKMREDTLVALDIGSARGLSAKIDSQDPAHEKWA
jgi:hypothetical protein